MLSPLNNSELDDYVQRLNAQLRKMSPQERAEVNQELRQHLEAQAKAHEELGATPAEAMQAALRSFGDPTKIGRQMYQEWRRASPSDLSGVLRTMGWLFLSVLCLMPVAALLHLVFPASPARALNAALQCLALVGVPLRVGALVGKRFGARAVPIALYGAATYTTLGMLVFACLAWAVGAPRLSEHGGQVMMHDAAYVSLAGLSAYVTSARRRGGWYRLRLSDLKLRLR